MKTSLKNGLTAGLIFGLIFIFFMLIGFTRVGTDMIGSILGNTSGLPDDGPRPVTDLLIFSALLGVINGITARKSDANETWLATLLGGLIAGLTAGLMTGIFIFFAGQLHYQDVDFRTYLPRLGPAEMRYLLFFSTPFGAARTYLTYLSLASLGGAAFARAVLQASWLKQSLGSLSRSAETLARKAGLDRWRRNPWVVLVILALAGVLLYFLPLVWGSYWNYIMGTVAIYILLGIGLNIIVGFSGQLVLGYVAFFATGAYTFALLTAPEPHALGMNLWLAIGLSVLVSTLTGLLLGLPILNLRGDYLAIVTLGFGEITRILIKSDLLTFLTNGPKGVTDVGQPTWLGQVFSDVNYVHFLMLLVLLALFVAKRLKDSRTGRAWIAIREDQTVAQATGVNTYRMKILALALGAAFAGLGGALFASRNQFTGPEDFTLMVSVNVLCIVIVGGMGSLPGVVIGAFVLKGLPELLRELADYRLLVFGALLVAMMILRPEGLWPARRINLENRQRDHYQEDPEELEVRP
jgi:ABC-type branched-subunit amino acid transport system permease subunit